MGRAMVLLSLPVPELPAGWRIVRYDYSPLSEQTWMIVEGPGLPRWEPGMYPLRFQTFDELRAWCQEHNRP